MKIQCDVCNKEEASVFCSADEAALCGACDHRVHLANKLASNHHRFPLQYPSYKDASRCDVCQERRAFLFCKEDRAIICRECDNSIHTANEHTQKHNRFLLTGVKLSSSMITRHPTTTTTTSSSKGRHTSVDTEIINNKQPMRNTELVPNPQQKITNSVEGGGSTNSISEYLEMLPGWHVEDFLDPSSSAPPLHNGYWKTDDLMPFFDSDIRSDMGCFHSDDHLAIWVLPQAPASGHKVEKQKNGNGLFKELNEMVNTNTNMKSSKGWSDHGFTVPQINPSSS